MNLGNILKNIIERKSTTYPTIYDGFFTNISALPDISNLKIDPILVITDQSPYSLIALAYTNRLVEALGKDTKIYAITEGKHTETIKKFSKENNIKLQEIVEFKDPTVEDIHKFVDKNNIELIVISYAHKLKKVILDTISVTVLISSLKNI